MLSGPTPTPTVNTAETSAPAGLSGEELDKFIRGGWGFSAENEANIVKQLGNPNRVNRHRGEFVRGQTAEFIELQYNGMSAEFVDNQLLELTVTDAKFPVAHELGVGFRSERIVQVLGRPMQRKDGQISDTDWPNGAKDGEIFYFDRFTGQSSVHFKCVGGYVTSVTWSIGEILLTRHRGVEANFLERKRKVMTKHRIVFGMAMSTSSARFGGRMAFLLLGFAVSGFSASFDCAKAQSKTEKLICQSAILSRADEEMAAATA